MDNGAEERSAIISELLQRVEENSVQTLIEDNITPVKGQESEDVLELGDNFSLDRFQVVRREFFAHLREPTVTFSNCKFIVNMACLKRFPETDFVQVLINRNTKTMVLRPSKEGVKDAFPWCSQIRDVRKPKQVSCKLFFAKMFSFMSWNTDFRYKLMGRVIHAKGEYLLAFDLTATEVFQRNIQGKQSRSGMLPEDWQDQFGLPFSEHQKSMQVNVFDGYAVFAIKDPSAKSIASEILETQTQASGEKPEDESNA